MEEESKEHILNCKEILKTRKDDEKPPEYKNLFKGNTSLQLDVAKYFDENMRRRKKMLNNGWKVSIKILPRLGTCDRDICICSVIVFILNWKYILLLLS